jgi:hypothetical protein
MKFVTDAKAEINTELMALERSLAPKALVYLDPAIKGALEA